MGNNEKPAKDMRSRTTPEHVTSLDADEIFVFGSNLEGMHQSGAARTAMQWGAVMGQGVGLQGQTYAIPTMFSTVQEIKPYVDDFIYFAENHSELRFLVTKIGCGIAGFDQLDMAHLFIKVLEKNIKNICIPEDFVIDIAITLGLGKD